MNLAVSVFIIQIPSYYFLCLPCWCQAQEKPCWVLDQVSGHHAEGVPQPVGYHTV